MAEKKLQQQYQALINEGEIQSDSAQLVAIDKLERVLNYLRRPLKRGWWPFSKIGEQRGLYLWGSVGTGKTLLMDLFYKNLDAPKMRLHFFRFMKMVHDELKKIEGKKNPLSILARKITKDIKVICFDEFVVTNIVDAMLLSNLLQALFNEGIVFIATSNTEPDNLYKGGLQRDKFLPAIEFIKTYTEVVRVDSGVDYRLQKHDVTDTFLLASSEGAETKFTTYLKAYHIDNLAVQAIKLNDRQVECLGASEYGICFTFDKICGVPRSQLDYITLSEQYEAVFIKDFRKIEQDENDKISTLISLIDVFYDAHIKLIILSDVGIKEIYTGGLYQEAFNRTSSRLYDMQTQDYLDHPRIIANSL